MTILVADIGATNSRFQLAEQGELTGSLEVLATGDFDASTGMVEAAHARLSAPQLDGAVLAVAGPTNAAGDCIEVTNTGLRFEAAALGAALGCEVALANDFYALAHAVPYCTALERIGAGHAAHGPKALIGPGTGLGMATLVPIGERWHVLASEGGHADLAPGSFLETELWGLLVQAHGHVSWETVLCGRGLQNLYRAMSELWGSRAETLTPAEISARGVDLDDPVCHQTLDTFCSLLGAAAGNLALTVGAVGGVYIGGGIVPQMLDFVRASPLRRRFEERGDLSGYAEAIPISVIMDANPGLLGALHCYKSKTGEQDG